MLASIICSIWVTDFMYSLQPVLYLNLCYDMAQWSTVWISCISRHMILWSVSQIWWLCIVRPHCMRSMEQTIAADGAVWSASSCLFATTRTPAKMAELIEIWVEDLIGPEEPCIRWGCRFSQGKRHFGDMYLTPIRSESEDGQFLPMWCGANYRIYR